MRRDDTLDGGDDLVLTYISCSHTDPEQGNSNAVIQSALIAHILTVKTRRAPLTFPSRHISENLTITWSYFFVINDLFIACQRLVSVIYYRSSVNIF